jgi:hypothetical protein
MSNVCEYVKWRGDLTLKQSKFNEIDALILTRLSYFPFDQLIQPNEEATVEELSKRFEKADKSTMKILWEDDNELFPLMGKSERFGKMSVTQYVNKINAEQEKQFSATTVILPDNTIFVTYRGTDATIVGWKEDFNMCFKSHIASQKDAVEYLNMVSKKYKRLIRIGGHSKGGNLAVYAAMFTNSKVKKRIINIYNNDGPGFDDEIIKTKEYKEILPKVHTYIPQSSVIGRLLNHEEKYTVVQSIQKGIMQHDLYSWQLEGKEFICLEKVTNGSEIFDKTLKEWLINITPEQRGIVIDTAFDILNTTEVEYFSELKKNWFLNIRLMLGRYKNLDDESKKVISEIVQKLVSTVKNIISNEMISFRKSKKENENHEQN